VSPYPNDAVTPEGHTFLVHALRHEWEADDLDDDARQDILRTAEGLNSP